MQYWHTHRQRRQIKHMCASVPNDATCVFVCQSSRWLTATCQAEENIEEKRGRVREAKWMKERDVAPMRLAPYFLLSVSHSHSLSIHSKSFHQLDLSFMNDTKVSKYFVRLVRALSFLFTIKYLHGCMFCVWWFLHAQQALCFFSRTGYIHNWAPLVSALRSPSLAPQCTGTGVLYYNKVTLYALYTLINRSLVCVCSKPKPKTRPTPANERIDLCMECNVRARER